MSLQTMPIKKIIIGVDPGAKGAFCALDVETKNTLFFSTIGHPQESFNALVELQQNCHIIACLVEEVHSLAGVSAKSNFQFGGNFRQTYIMAQCAGILVNFVPPNIWQKKVGVHVPATIKGEERRKAIKQQVAEICTSIYPNAEIYGPKGGLIDGRSDSLMIAHYATKIYLDR